MKKNKVFLLISVVMVLLIGVASVAYAAEYRTPAEIIAGLTGKSVEDVAAARQAGDSYGEQAIAAGVEDEFQAARLENLKIRLDEAVAAGRLTQEEADKLYETMAARFAECDGTCDNSGSGAGLRGILGSRQGGGQARGGRGMMGRGNGSGICTMTGTSVQ